MRIILTILFLISIVQAQTLKPKIFYDLSDAVAPNSGNGNPADYFNKYGIEDPKNGTFVNDSTHAAPTRLAYWFPQQVIFDLTGDKNPFLIKKFNITDIYWLDDAGFGDDTMDVFNLDPLFSTIAYANRPAGMSDWNTYLTPIAKLGSSIHGSSFRFQWQGITVSDSCRYLGIRLRANPGRLSHPDYNELVIYGTPRFDTTTTQPVPTVYTGPYPKSKTFHELSGINNLVFTSPEVWKYHGLERWYNILALSDDQNVPLTATTPLYNFDPTNSGPGRLWPYDSAKVWNSTILNAFKGASNRVNIQNGSGTFIPPTDSATDNSELYESYDRVADFYKYFVWKMGRGNQTPSIDKWRNNNGYAGYNLGLMTDIELGNEDPMSIQGEVVKARHIYDAVHPIDSSCKIHEAGNVFISENRLRTEILLFKVLFADHEIPFDYFNVHWYPRTGDDAPGNPTIEEKVNQHGRSPEQDHLPQRLKRYADLVYILTGDTSKKIELTETGYDNNPNYPTNTTESGANYTISAVPVMSGYTALQSRAILGIRLKLSTMAVHGVNSIVTYTGSNDYDSANANRTLFATSGLVTKYGGGSSFFPDVFYPAYWMEVSVNNALPNYYPDSTYSFDSTGICQIRYRLKSNPDSIAHVVWKGTINGSTQSAVIPTTAIYGTVTTPSFTDAVGTTTAATISGGGISLTATEMPVIVKYYETGIPLGTFIIYRKVRTHL